MDTTKAMLRSMAADLQNNRHRVFDWDKAARLIKESGAKTAGAGLESDWEWTGGEILTDGKPNKESYTYLASNWATPELTLDDGPPIPCWVYEDESAGWSSDTKWPESALAILEGR